MHICREIFRIGATNYEYPFLFWLFFQTRIHFVVFLDCELCSLHSGLNYNHLLHSDYKMPALRL